MKVMIDLNIFLDVFQKRHPHYQDSSILLTKILNKEGIEGYIAGHCLTTIFYLLERYSGYQKAMDVIELILDNFEVKAADKKLFRNAKDMNMKDFEDAVVSVCAESAGCNYIITRNIPDFEKSRIQAITPRAFLEKNDEQLN